MVWIRNLSVMCCLMVILFATSPSVDDVTTHARKQKKSVKLAAYCCYTCCLYLRLFTISCFAQHLVFNALTMKGIAYCIALEKTCKDRDKSFDIQWYTVCIGRKKIICLEHNWYQIEKGSFQICFIFSYSVFFIYLTKLKICICLPQTISVAHLCRWGQKCWHLSVIPASLLLLVQ